MRRLPAILSTAILGTNIAFIITLIALILFTALAFVTKQYQPHIFPIYVATCIVIFMGIFLTLFPLRRKIMREFVVESKRIYLPSIRLKSHQPPPNQE